MSTNAVMVQRIREQMKKTGISARELAEKAEVGRSFIYDILSGKSSNPTTKKIAAVAGVLGVSVPYLLDENAISEDMGADFIKIPFVSQYSLVEGTLQEEKSGSNFYLQKDFAAKFNSVSADLRVLRVQGDSMQPTLLHNDVILVDLTKKSPTPPGVFVVHDGIGVTIKRLECVSGAVEAPMLNIHSDNPHYASYSGRQADLRIIGRAIWFARDL